MGSELDYCDVPDPPAPTQPIMMIPPPPNTTFPTKPPQLETESNVLDKAECNGWTPEDESMLNSWCETLKRTSFAYQYLIDKSYQISTRLSLISICSSSILSIFAGFKLWVQDNRVFQSTGDIVMLFSNFLIAAITTASKRYLDDQKNQKIKAYLEEADKFQAIVFTQMSMVPKYRMPAKDFFNKYKDIYTKIMTSMPNVSIKEITMAQQKYKEFERTIQSYEDDEKITVEIGTMTENNIFVSSRSSRAFT